MTLDGDEADSVCYLQAQHVRPGTMGGDTLIVAGRYLDRFVRTADGWRIAQRRLEIGWTDGNPAVLARQARAQIRTTAAGRAARPAGR